MPQPIPSGLLAPLAFLFLLVPTLSSHGADLPPAEQPDAPTTVETACVSPREITLYWSSPRAGSPSAYRVYRDDKLLASPGPGEKRFTDHDLQPGTTHHYTVSALYPDHEARSHTVYERLAPAFAPQRSYDLVVASASSAGVAAAVTAARKGMRVALVESTDRLGGIMSNGLCATDLRQPAHATGPFAEFRSRVQEYYGGGAGLHYEPHVVNNIFKQMVAEQPGIDLYLRTAITGVLGQSDRVTGVVARSLDTGKSFRLLAPMTIDADPTGDVSAWAGCRCRVGREARSAEEPHAGVIYYWRAQDRLLPGSTGKADRRLMAYCYLLVVKDYGPASDHRIPPPPGYQESDFIHSPAWADSWAASSGVMPNNKFELNQHPQGNDLQEINYGWPEMSAARRRQVETLYRDHALGYLYYLQTHDGEKSLGLPDDEFPENGGFPETLYVREARRIVGLTTLTESDVSLGGERIRADGGGIGDYTMDSHAVRKKVDWSTPDMGEGEYWLVLHTPWYQIPIGVVIPADRDGLLVAEAVSATHVGYGTLRLEPVRMEMGALCAALADFSRRLQLDPRDLPPTLVQDDLIKDGQRIFWHADVEADGAHSPAIQFMSSHGYWTDQKFQGDEPITRQEADKALQALQWMESTQAGSSGSHPPKVTRVPPPGNNAGVLKSDTPDSTLLTTGDSNKPLTRGDLAMALVAVQSLLSSDWRTDDTPNRRPYPDVDPTTPVGSAAILLWRHYIRMDSWHNTRFTSGGVAYFDPELPVTRADFAQALFLAQREFPSPFYHPVNALVQIGPRPERPHS